MGGGGHSDLMEGGGHLMGGGGHSVLMEGGGHSDLMEAVMQQWLHTAAGQAAAQEAAQLRLAPEEVGQLFHARMLQSLGRMRVEAPPDFSMR